ncbi:hypothetical protein [Halalkalibacter akibai]|uniref:DUF3679 domain-containing protein n=1 Tax=Halalkalibacter akibai (strain ATCC 43226 / DSM 21942 / CIP 109018 / JCM 9157 / 1139) TaxID=1236973 RepID=W4QPS7_HALA3|nr:hypothetical protein [Halalkalibacter akibai]GAE33349.1 hypothetical protein JCM9157_347 [Halalkalibacter akibai JCM 9157]
MKKLVVRIGVIGILILLGALFGVQQMNEALGISQPVPLLIETKETQPKKEKLEKEESPNTKLELVAKKETVEKVGRFNFFSDMGNSIADGFNFLSRSLLSQVMSFVNNILNGYSSDE